jgi:hypothetical protein
MTFSRSLQSLLVGVFVLGAAAANAEGEWPNDKRALVEAAVANMMSLDRPGQVGLATVFDGNKFVQCRRIDDRSIRCEAAGALMQPSLSYTLTGAKIEAMEAFGWTNDASFGNWIQTFPADGAPQRIANEIETALADVYDADPKTTEAHTDWVAKQACLPRVADKLDRAGSVNVDRRREADVIRACAYTPANDAGPSVKNGDLDDLMAAYGARVSGELQRLRVNLDGEVFCDLRWRDRLCPVRAANQTGRILLRGGVGRHSAGASGHPYA